MIEQLSNAITFYSFYVASQAGATGLTVTVDVYEGTTATPIISGASATELAGGLYYYTLSSGSVDAIGQYIAIFKTTDATVDQKDLPAVWTIGTAGVENLDAAISNLPTAAEVWTSGTRTLTSVSGITVSSPLAADGQHMEVVQGDDYANDDGRSFEWTSSSWPDLTGSTIVWTYYNLKDTADTAVVSMTAPTVGSGSQTIRLELTAAVTKLMTDGVNRYVFDVQATLQTSGNIITLVDPQSTITVLKDRTNN